MQITFEVVSGHNDPRPMHDKKSGEVRFYRQHVFADLGGPYPVKVQAQVKDPMAPGRYVGQLPVRVGQYDAIEIHPFEVWQVRPAKPEEVRKVS